MAGRRQTRREKLHSDHLEASREHALWKQDVERWQASYRQALIECAHRFAEGLELDNFEALLSLHEAAIAAHEEVLVRHERTLRLEGGPEIGLSDEALDFHRLMDSRHALSRKTHEQLERSHRAILAALAMLGPHP